MVWQINILCTFFQQGIERYVPSNQRNKLRKNKHGVQETGDPLRRGLREGGFAG
jgi:hypothetical protein